MSRSRKNMQGYPMVLPDTDFKMEGTVGFRGTALVPSTTLL